MNVQNFRNIIDLSFVYYYNHRNSWIQLYCKCEHRACHAHARAKNVRALEHKDRFEELDLTKCNYLLPTRLITQKTLLSRNRLPAFSSPLPRTLSHSFDETCWHNNVINNYNNDNDVDTCNCKLQHYNYSLIITPKIIIITRREFYGNF